MKLRKIFAILLSALLALTFVSAFAAEIPAPEGDDNKITIGATEVPHAQIIEGVVKPALEAAGFASEPLADRHLLLLLYVIRGWSGTPRALEADGLIWCRPEEMEAWPMPPADGPLVRQLRAYLGFSAMTDAPGERGML